MVRLLTGAFEAILLAVAAYNLAVAVFGWRNPQPAQPSPGDRRFRVLVPAHDEEAVIGSLLSDLAGQDYLAEMVSTWVLADRCGDRTVDIAREAGVSVVERSDGPEGKGAAIGWYLGNHPLDPDEALVVLDADNRIPADLLSRFDAELGAGNQALQAYLDISNPEASAVATASALSYWASNRMVQLARANLGWPADLGGTGMCLTAPAIEAAGGFGTSLAEDQELGVRLFLAGVPVVWVHDLKVRDEKPRSAKVAVRQRSRWASGRKAVARKYFWPLLRTRSAAGWDLALRLVQPSRMGVALASALLTVASALGAPLLHWALWAAAAGIQVLAPLPFLVRDRVPVRYLWKYPLLVVLPILKIPARLRRSRGWYHTPHAGS